MRGVPMELLREEFVSRMVQRLRGNSATTRDVLVMPGMEDFEPFMVQPGSSAAMRGVLMEP
jgi:hypothetical protein